MSKAFVAKALVITTLTAMSLVATDSANAMACKAWCGKYRNAATCYDDCDRRAQPDVPDRAPAAKISCDVWCSNCRGGAPSCTGSCYPGKMVNPSCNVH